MAATPDAEASVRVKTLKAYSVTETCEDTGGIVYAEHHAVARREGASQFGDGDWSSVECRRAPEFDQYAEAGGPTLAQMQEHGWWTHCPCCERRICGLTWTRDDGEEMDAYVDRRDGSVWCGPLAPLSLVESVARRRAETRMAKYLASQGLPEGVEFAGEGLMSGGRNSEHRDVYGPFPPKKRGHAPWTGEDNRPETFSVFDRERVEVKWWTAKFRFPGSERWHEWNSDRGGHVMIDRRDLYDYYLWRGKSEDEAARLCREHGIEPPCAMEKAA